MSLEEKKAFYKLKYDEYMLACSKNLSQEKMQELLTELANAKIAYEEEKRELENTKKLTK